MKIPINQIHKSNIVYSVIRIRTLSIAKIYHMDFENTKHFKLLRSLLPINSSYILFILDCILVMVFGYGFDAVFQSIANLVYLLMYSTSLNNLLRYSFIYLVSYLLQHLVVGLVQCEMRHFIFAQDFVVPFTQRFHPLFIDYCSLCSYISRILDWILVMIFVYRCDAVFQSMVNLFYLLMNSSFLNNLPSYLFKHLLSYLLAYLVVGLVQCEMQHFIFAQDFAVYSYQNK